METKSLKMDVMNVNINAKTAAQSVKKEIVTDVNKVGIGINKPINVNLYVEMDIDQKLKYVMITITNWVIFALLANFNALIIVTLVIMASANHVNQAINQIKQEMIVNQFVVIK